MATIGVSQPMCAKYNFDPDTGEISYSDGMSMGKATQVDVVINTSEDNNLYGNNGIAEADRQFTDGTITVGTDDLSQEVSKLLLGVKEIPLDEIPGITDTGLKELIYDDSMENPYFGQGYIEKKQKENVVRWRAVIFTKTIFNVPDESATTQGERIKWQTPELVATIMRDDSETHRWKRECTFTTEAQAAAYIRYRLGIKPTGGGEEPQALRAALAKGAGGDKV